MYQKCFDKISNSETSCVLRLEDRAVIPFDPANTDYQAYLRWCEEGNTAEPADKPVQPM